MKTGLVMEGGSMRGMFTCGVIDVLMEHGITFDGAIGVSAGAVFGCNYKSKQIGRGIRYNKKFCKDPRFGSYKNLIFHGEIFDTKFCYEDIPYEHDIFDVDAYQKNPMEFYVTTTDVETGKPVYKNCMKGDKNDITWMRASASMPIVSKIVEVDGYKLLDGGIADSIPLEYFQSLGYEKNLVILTRSEAYQKEKTGALPMAKLMLRKYPKMIEAMADRHIRYNANTAYIKEQEKSDFTFVIRPKEELNIKSITSDPNELERVYQIGRKTAEEKLEEVIAWRQNN